MVRRGILFVISGPSGVGKGTIKDALLLKLQDIKLSISATTRSMREGEMEGLDYFYLSPEEFTAKLENDEFLEYAPVYSNMYGTPRKYVMDNIQRGYDVLLEIDIQGALKVKDKMPEGVFIFIQPPSIEALAQRINGRGKDSPESIQTRLAACREEMAMVIHYDYLVINDELDEAMNKVQSIIIAERCRVKNMY
ncbi:MAG: guanylate kinase [Firmicutes bacterium HGW-Firmicutes-15]|nr:MAG: guanylate kinase [Firmicutes bacterium HGW-Firmicutes-15]